MDLIRRDRPGAELPAQADPGAAAPTESPRAQGAARVLLVGVASCFTVIINTWRGVKTVKPIWLRAAEAMGAGEGALFRQVILPATLPHILTGLRLGLAAAWRILVAVEMLMSVTRGLGWLIFGSQQFLNIDVMLATIAVIGVIGMLLERELFARIERATVVRWGMMTR